jgi:hypothetical protein
MMMNDDDVDDDELEPTPRPPSQPKQAENCKLASWQAAGRQRFRQIIN